MPDIHTAQQHEWEPVVTILDRNYIPSTILRKVFRVHWYWCVSLPHNWRCVGGRHRGRPPFFWAERMGFTRTEAMAKAKAEKAAQELLARPCSDFIQTTTEHP